MCELFLWKQTNKKTALLIFNPFCNAQIKGALFKNWGFQLTPLFSRRLQRRGGNPPAFLWQDLSYVGRREGGKGASLCARPSLCNAIRIIWQWWLTSKATVQIIPFSMPSRSKSRPLRMRGKVPALDSPCRPASSAQRGRQGSFLPELGFTMNADWHQEATLGPQSLLKTLAASQGSSNFAAQREPCWQLVRSQGVTRRPGGNNIFQNAQANSPMTGDSKDYRYALPCPRCWGSHPSPQSAEATLRWPSMAELGTHPLFHATSWGCSIQAKSGFYLLSCSELF